ncbi:MULTISPECIES: peptidylprolyl isomerase [Clostridium]|jgi:Parvulin-like peptidyl-prolyl isomerase|uniref:Peptidyl-prolyl cis-trans isomerase n=4 Tax=Clostridium TaxID=1485 RepID=A0A0B5QI05_CLOBE|nr:MULTISPECIES: peptidyl-prolyl cis-trans isomerase [Clostridium]ABR36996.1 PpiC-type peptidyl-prolyl cis-trans isomerase [Clostridium beijerinckii NCIMB 8052]AIU03186.1 PpiC-type peptidyl-prolyl cis-trans isomerase [Clostridium beijerinckii ATCC 35702]AJH02010.1 peptidylprolyl isomerase [Clostridium beijerinckii]AQS07754.1 putative peptidyl-prolyl cis-trans isomerase Cbf2 precursor [Clostridium beijerinckii]AVK48810.1 peptidylprolyl isomerase [Clostridium sp. MF28]
MENKVLAVAAGYEITEKDLNAIISRYPQEQRGALQSEEKKKQLVEQLISFELMNKFGKEIQLDKTQEYKDAMENISKEVITSMAINKVLSDVTITDEEVKKYYEDNKEAFGQPATVSARHILVETEEEANKAREEILSGKISFGDAAMKYSTCPSNQQGGNLGEFSKGMMVPEFEEAAFTSEIGKVTEPVKTQFGYHLVLVDAKNEASIKSFEEVKDSVLDNLIKENQHKKYDQILKELEAKYGVERK